MTGERWFVHITSASGTQRTYSLDGVPRRLHWLATEAFSWHAAVAEVRAKRRAEFADLVQAWRRR
jgi:hypothetical protein